MEKKTWEPHFSVAWPLVDLYSSRCEMTSGCYVFFDVSGALAAAEMLYIVKIKSLLYAAGLPVTVRL